MVLAVSADSLRCQQTLLFRTTTPSNPEVAASYLHFKGQESMRSRNNRSNDSMKKKQAVSNQYTLYFMCHMIQRVHGPQDIFQFTIYVARTCANTRCDVAVR